MKIINIAAHSFTGSDDGVTRRLRTRVSFQQKGLEAWRQLRMRRKSNSGQNSLGTLENIMFFEISGTLDIANWVRNAETSILINFH